MKRDSSFPLNPAEPVEVTPREYEEQVVKWLKAMANPPISVEVGHLERLRGKGGEYEFDAVARFSIFGGAEVLVLVECKRWTRPVNREVLLALAAKSRDVGAHKAMVFSTSGFQSGALEFAASEGIATITFFDGRWLYETRAATGPVEPPPWVKLPRFAGKRVKKLGSKLFVHVLDDDQVNALDEWARDALAGRDVRTSDGEGPAGA